MSLHRAIARALGNLPCAQSRLARVPRTASPRLPVRIVEGGSNTTTSTEGHLHVVHQDDLSKFVSQHKLSRGEVRSAIAYALLSHRDISPPSQAAALEGKHGGKTLTRFPQDSPMQVLTISDQQCGEQLAALVGSATRSLLKSWPESSKQESVQVDLSEKLAAGHAEATMRAAALGTYTFTPYKTVASDSPPFVDVESMSGTGLSSHQAATLSSDVAGAMLARTVGNARGSDMTPMAFVQFLRDLLHDTSPDMASLSVIAGQADVEAAGMGMLAAVGRGANPSRAGEKGPALAHVQYRGGVQGGAVHTAFVGKGITFDTGGLNLKPTGAIEGMHIDMGGAAAVLGALVSTLSSKPAANVDFVFALAENAIGPDAVKPMDIVQGLSGKTVEVGNTDAEGRLALADAMTYVQHSCGAPPQRIVDVGTLTGACVVALGHHAAGLFSNDDAFAAQLCASGASVQERLWRMPVFPEHEKEITGGSAHADLMSIGAGREAGACTAAAFLKQFVEEGVQWAHVDIAGPGMLPKDSGVYSAGATGFAAQTLAAYIRSLEGTEGRA